MSPPSDTLVTQIARMAAVASSRAAMYGNYRVNGHRQVFKRRFSPVGFDAVNQVTYVTPAAMQVTTGVEPRQGVNLVILAPYGHVEDAAKLSSTDPADRVVYPMMSSSPRGLYEHPDDVDVLLAKYGDPAAASQQKTIAAVRRLLGRSGSYGAHALVSRQGDVIIAAAIDDIASLAGHEIGPRAIVILYETELAITAQEAARHGTNFFESSLSLAQLDALAAFFHKLKVVYPTLAFELISGSAARSGSAGVVTWQRLQTGNVSAPFESALFENPTHGRIDYSGSSFTNFIARVNRRIEARALALNTDIFRTGRDPEADARENARAGMNANATAGEHSAEMAGYATVAATARASSIIETTPDGHFEEAVTETRRRSDELSYLASAVALGVAESRPNAPRVENPSGYIYDYTTGRWLDNQEPV